MQDILSVKSQISATKKNEKKLKKHSSHLSYFVAALTLIKACAAA